MVVFVALKIKECLMNKLITILFFIALIIPQKVYAQSGATEAVNNNDKKGVYLDLGGRSDPNALAGELGFAAFPYKHISYRASFSFLLYEKNDDILLGVNGGVRYNFGEKFSPFVGLGSFLGSNQEEIPAENDNIDNDNDGSTDEDGEVITETKDVMASRLLSQVNITLLQRDEILTSI
jgi:hypothetical protein